MHFVQIDEFYPIYPTQQNSFYYYIEKFYISEFGFDIGKCLLIDCSRVGIPKNLNIYEVWPNGVNLSLRYLRPRTNLEKKQKSVLEAVDQWCYMYEEKIRSLGGIGFFLGGIGPDGHIAYNVQNSDHNSATRLAYTNYESQAASAIDLGGIEVAEKRSVITIGLSTITYNPQCTAIIIAAGEAKAKVIQNAVERREHISYPATALQKLPNARFYITSGASKLLTQRRYDNFTSCKLSKENQEQVVTDIALKLKKRICELDEGDFRRDKFGNVLLRKKSQNIYTILKEVEQNLICKLHAGLKVHKNKTFLHTAPHHDDILLGYIAYVLEQISDSNKHTFVYMTSGFNSVTNKYARQLVRNSAFFMKSRLFKKLIREGYFNSENRLRSYDVWQYLDGVTANDPAIKNEGITRRIIRNLMEILEEKDIRSLKYRIEELLHYFSTQYPGRKDPIHIQQLKGSIREYESECLWARLGFDSTCVKHLRLGFYNGNIFNEEPELNRDVMPILQLLRSINPDIITVAMDPEGSGPDTHYKTLQAIAAALKIYEQEANCSEIEVIGYRNVWYRFHISESNLIIPVTANILSVMQESFINSFVSQRDASFPSHEYKGPFSELARKIQVEQYQTLKTCLGQQFFINNTDPTIRAAHGCVFLRRMGLREFFSYARELRKLST